MINPRLDGTKGKPHTQRKKKAEKICGQRFQRLWDFRKGICGACAYWIIGHVA